MKYIFCVGENGAQWLAVKNSIRVNKFTKILLFTSYEICFTARELNGCQPVQQPGGDLRPKDQKSVASDIAKEVLSYRQDG